MNKRASGSEGKNWASHLQRHLFRSTLLYHSPENLTQLENSIQEDLERDVDTFICVGGDGTVNTLIQHLANKNVSLLVIPSGTANDLASHLGNHRNLNKVIHTVRMNQTQAIDLISINGRYMATNGGVGLGASVSQKINVLRKRFPLVKQIMRLTGKKIYSAMLATELLRPELKRYTVKFESEEFNDEVTAPIILINNQPVLAGTFFIAPKTLNNDGKFNVSILKHASRANLIECITKIALQVPINNDPDFIQFETKKIKIKSSNPNSPFPFFGDGEVFKAESEYDIEIAPKALKVYSPFHNALTEDVNTLSPPEVVLQ